MNVEPVSLRVSSLGGLNTRVTRGNGYVYYETLGLHKTGIFLSFPDINTARGVVLTTIYTDKGAAIVGTTHRPRVYSLTTFLGSYNTGVCNTNRDAVRVRNIRGLCPYARHVVPSEVITTACVYTNTVRTSRLIVGGVHTSRLAPVVPIFNRTKYGVCLSNNGLGLISPGELGTIGGVGAVPCPNFPASYRSVIVTTVTITHNASIFGRDIFSNECGRVDRLGEFNTSVATRNEVTIIGKIGRLCNTGIFSASLHNNTTLILTTLATNNASYVNGICRVSHNCRYVRGSLDGVNTLVGEVDSRKWGGDWGAETQTVWYST